jgi:antibiotic biosynthesis monooxygenase (ABM) superfamily enzyme
MTNPVTVVVRRRVKPGLEAQYEAWLARLTAGAAQNFPGYVGAEFHRPPRPGAAYRGSVTCQRWSGSRLRISGRACWPKLNRCLPGMRPGSG